MMRSLFSGVSGLKSHQTRMDVIGNNIANINTAGFKSVRTTFSDMLSQTSSGASRPTANLGGTNAKQIGLGAAVASIDLIFNDGSLQSTGKNTDVAMSGNGLFVLKNGDNYFYSRDGAFEFDADGNYVLPGSGLRVQGWNGNNGVINTNGATEDINVQAGKTMEATATANVDYSGNFNAGALSITKITYTSGGATSHPESVVTTDPAQTDTEVVTSVNVDGTNVIAATLTLSDGSTMPVTSGFYQVGKSVPVTTVVTVYDSEGKEHAVTLLFDKDSSSVDPSANADAISLAKYKITVGSDTYVTTSYDSVVRNSDTGVYTLTNAHYTDANGSDVTLASTSADSDSAIWDNRWRMYIAPEEGQLGPAVEYAKTEEDGSSTTGILNGVIGSDGILTGSTSYIYFTSTGAYSSAATQGGSITLSYSNGNGAADTVFALNFAGLTQYSGNTTAYGTGDGNAYGVLQSISIDGSGVITGTYTNGVIQNEAQIAAAQFVNSAGLTRVGTSLYQQSNNSGVANIKTIDALGLSVTASSLEMSNVDLASELSDMIITQRGFQSNSKIITTSDEMLETLINMKR